MTGEEQRAAGPGSAPSTARRILVVGVGESFSQKLVEYAVWFAKRLDYEVVALNCVTVGQEAPAVLTPYQDDLERDFEAAAAKGAELLAYRAATEGLGFRHLVKFGSPDRCIREAHDEVEGLEFVFAEPDACPEVDMEAAIPIFTYYR